MSKKEMPSNVVDIFGDPAVITKDVNRFVGSIYGPTHKVPTPVDEINVSSGMQDIPSENLRTGQLRTDDVEVHSIKQKNQRDFGKGAKTYYELGEELEDHLRDILRSIESGRKSKNYEQLWEDVVKKYANILPDSRRGEVKDTPTSPLEFNFIDSVDS